MSLISKFTYLCFIILYHIVFIGFEIKLISYSNCELLLPKSLYEYLKSSSEEDVYKLVSTGSMYGNNNFVINSNNYI